MKMADVTSTPWISLDCGAKFPVKVVAFQTDEGRVTLDPPAVMRCGMARADRLVEILKNARSKSRKTICLECGWSRRGHGRRCSTTSIRMV